jgi:release factor glutamine methyltransferase
MKTSEWHREIRQQLTAIYELPEASEIAFRLMEFYAGISRTDLITDKTLSYSATPPWAEALQRLLKHEPLQYVLGEAWFYHAAFVVNEAVLIPRRETEELVELIISQNPPSGKQIRILDVGTGSGCIAISLALAMSHADVYACDVSVEALSVAQKNAERLGAKVHFSCCDVLKDGGIAEFAPLDVVVSNPPYVMEKERNAMRVNVLSYEPALALFVPDDDPLLFYRAIGLQALTVLKRLGGKLYFEINEQMALPAVRLLVDQGFTNVQINKDLLGKNRMLSAQL